MSETKSTLFDYTSHLSSFTKDLLTANTDAEFDEAFDNWLLHGMSQLEQNSKAYASLGEDALSSVLASALSTGELSVTRETHSNGHVDLTVKLVNSTANRVKLGEAKLWKSLPYQTAAITQLLGRYTTGRECRGFVISYVKQKDIKGLFEKLRAHIDNKKPFDLDGICKDHGIRWAFLSAHSHSSGELVEVCHVGCNLFVLDD